VTTLVKYQQLLFHITTREQGRALLYNIMLYFLSIRNVDPVERVYKEVSDRTLLGPILSTAVYWIVVMT